MGERPLTSGPDRFPTITRRRHPRYRPTGRISRALHSEIPRVAGDMCSIMEDEHIDRATGKRCRLVEDRAFIPLKTRPTHGKTLKFLYDSGAQASILTEADFRTLRSTHTPYKVIDSDGVHLTAANNTPMPFSRVVAVTLHTPSAPIRVPFFVCPGTSTSILGMNAIKAFNLHLDPVTLVADVRHPGPATVRAVAAGLPPMQARSLKNFDLEGREGKSRCLQEITDHEGNPVLGPATLTIVQPHKTVIVTTDERGRFHAPVDNLDPLMRQIRVGEVLAQVDSLDDHIYISEASIARTITKGDNHRANIRQHTEEEKEAIRERLRKTINAGTPYLYRQQVLDTLMEFEDVFSADKNDIGYCPLMEHEVAVAHDSPIFRPQFRIPQEHLAAIKSQTQAWIRAGIVRRCRSRYNNPIFAVPKATGGLRIVLDFRQLNDATLPDRYCIPSVDETIQEVADAGAEWFTSIDLSSGFYHVPLRQQDEDLTAYTLPGLGQFCWRRAAMGLTGSPATFCRILDLILGEMDNVVNYVDDVLIYTADVPRHLAVLRQVLTRLRRAGLRANAEKSVFIREEIDYLGVSISRHGVRTTLDKAQAVRELQPPTTKKELERIIGFFQYMARFAWHFSSKLYPLQILNQTKETGWKKGELPPAALKAFYQIRDELASRHTMGFILRDQPLHLYVDAALGDRRNNGKGFGAVLLQDRPSGILCPVAFLSRKLTASEENYPAGLAELRAIHWATEKLGIYLKHRPFHLYCDHKPLTDKMIHSLNRKTFAGMDTFRENFFPIWHHVAGKDNVISDFLSRYYGMSLQCPGEPKGLTGEARRAQARRNVALVSATAWIQSRTGGGKVRKQPRRTRGRKGPSGPRGRPGRLSAVSYTEWNPLNSDEHRHRIRWLQQEDPLCQEIIRDVEEEVHGSTLQDPIVATSPALPNKPVSIINDVLMVRATPTATTPLIPIRHFRILAPAAQRREILAACHGTSPFSGHHGNLKTLGFIAKDYWWPSMAADCDAFIKRCGICKEATDKGSGPRPPLGGARPPEHPNEMLHMDHMGPVRTARGKRYILSIMDALTRHLTVRLVRTKTPRETAEELFRYVTTFGVPRTILTDNGKAFCSAVNKELCRSLDIEHRVTAAYHPQPNGLVEESNKTVQNHIKKFIAHSERNSMNFEDLLMPLAFTYNTSPHTTTAMSPFEAKFGHAPRIPLWDDCSDILDQKHPGASELEHIARHTNALRDSWKICGELQTAEQKRRQAAYNRKHRTRTMVHTPRAPVYVRKFWKGPVNPKLVPNWTPGFIIRRQRPNTYVVWIPAAGRNKGGATTMLNSADIKPAEPGKAWLSADEWNKARAGCRGLEHPTGRPRRFPWTGPRQTNDSDEDAASSSDSSSSSASTSSSSSAPDSPGPADSEGQGSQPRDRRGHDDGSPDSLLQGEDGTHLSPDTLALLQPPGAEEEDHAPRPGTSGSRNQHPGTTADGLVPRGILRRRILRRSHSYPPAGDPEESESEQEETGPSTRRRKRKRRPASPEPDRRVRFRRGQVLVRDSQGSEDEDPNMTDPVFDRLSPRQQWQQPLDETERRSTGRGRPKIRGRTDAVGAGNKRNPAAHTNALKALRRRRRRPTDVDREIRRAKGPYDARFQAWAWKEILDGNITLEGQTTGPSINPTQTGPETAAPPPASTTPTEPGEEAQVPAQGNHSPPASEPPIDRDRTGSDRPETPPTPPPLPVRRTGKHAGGRGTERHDAADGNTRQATRHTARRTGQPTWSTGETKQRDRPADRRPAAPADPSGQQRLPRPTVREEAEEQRRLLARLTQRTREILGENGEKRRRQANPGRKPSTLSMWQRWKEHATTLFRTRDAHNGGGQRRFPRDRNPAPQHLHLHPHALPLRRLHHHLGGGRPAPPGRARDNAHAADPPATTTRRGAGNSRAPPTARGRGPQRSRGGGGKTWRQTGRQ